MAGKVLAELNKMPVIGRKTDILKDTNVKLRKIDKIFKMKFCQQNFFFFSQVRFQRPYTCTNTRQELSNIKICFKNLHCRNQKKKLPINHFFWNLVSKFCGLMTFLTWLDAVFQFYLIKNMASLILMICYVNNQT